MSARRRTIALALAALAAAAAQLAAQGPAADWRVAETPHFRVHFPTAAEAWSRRLAARLESVRTAVGAEVGFTPAARIDVVVGDPAALANGSAWPLLGSPRMVLWTTPPAAASTLGQRSDWGELVAVHEYAHLAHLSRPSRNPWRALAERTLLPLGPLATKSPRWAIEGYATLVEGRITGSGRPRSALRAALLRAWGRAGRLPSYDRLARYRDSFLGPSMAYFVGSAFLEWAERGTGDPRALQKLWAAASARSDRPFDEAWRRVFGRAPRASYARFVAETAAAALDAERALEPLAREGAVWLERNGATGEPAVSPDGRELAAVVHDRERRPRLVVWSLEAPEPESELRRAKRGRDDPDDPEAVAVPPRRRREVRALEPADAVELVGARYLRDGSGLLVTLLAPAHDGVRHAELALWPTGGRLRRLTRGGDLFDADPEPGGASAVAVRWRAGASELVRVALASGATTPLAPAALDVVHDQPRVAPDGRALAWLEHRDGRWRVELAPIGEDGALGAARELALAAGGEPSHLAWHARGTHLYLAVARAEGIDLEALAVAPGSRDHRVTRSLDAALAPAPAPDGATLFYLALDPDGLELRRLPLDAATLQLAIEPGTGAPLDAAAPPLAADPAAVSPTRAYALGRGEATPILAGFAGSDPGALELGLRSGDLLGRWEATALGAFGGDGARRGGALAATLRALPVELGLHLAELREGAERSSAAELAASRTLFSARGASRLTGGVAHSRFESPAVERTLGFVDVAWAGSFARGGFSARPELAAERVETLGGGRARWTSLEGALELDWRRTALELWASRAQSDAAAAERDLVRLGGAPSSLAPRRHEPGRREHPALPADALVGERIDAFGARLELAGTPAALFWERHEAAPGGGARLELVGLEVRGRMANQPLLGLPRLEWRIGVGHGREGIVEGETRWWLGLTLPGFGTPGRAATAPFERRAAR